MFLILLGGTLIIAQESTSKSKGLYFRNIGPANQGGRIVDIEAIRGDFAHVYAASASGGVWKSENAGTTWKPIFDDYGSASIGDIAIDQNNSEIIWVGTGEANNRNSVSWGDGIYKSTDGGATFTNKGLESTHQIARILVHPESSDDVCVCAIGHLWGYSGDRGVFHSEDGGESWSKMTNGLPNDGKTGCIDLVRSATDPDVMYAAFYHRLRQPWHFHSGGGEGGIFKTTNGGKAWKKLTNGLPAGPTGRIGLAIYEANPNIVMALVEAERTDDLTNPGSGIYRSEDGGESWDYVNTYNNRPFYYSQIRINPSDDQRVYVMTTRYMVSEDGGKTLTNGSEDQEIHGDFHALWLDPNDPDRYYIGADKGMSITHDHGKTFQLFDNFAIGQFYRINYDMREPYYVYGGFQDNGMYGTASFSRDARGILNDSNWKLHWGDGQYIEVNPNDWRDMYTSMENGSYFSYDPKTHQINRISPTSLSTINFRDHFSDTISDMSSALRYNWSAPMIMSPHDPTTLYVAGNHVFKSLDRGISWKIISPDLSTNDPVKRKQGVSGGITPDNTGAETHCAVSSLSVSTISEDIIWAGTDDGNVQVTTDGGKNWHNVRSNILEVPDGIWVSRVEASKFDPGRAYATFDGHRSDHFGTWIFRTDDYGKSWEKITTGISEGEVVRVIREDVVNKDLLFAGTETGVWHSLDGGDSWSRLNEGLPVVSVYDLKIHPRDNDLIVGTHGRSIYIMDDISPMQQLTDEVKDQSFHLFDQRQATLWENTSRGGQRGHFWYAGDNPKTVETTSSKARAVFANKAAISYYIGENTSGSPLTLTITDLKGTVSKEMEVSAEPGIHRIYWDLEFDVEPYSEEEYSFVDRKFQDLIDQLGFSSLRRMYDRFKEALTPYDQRKSAEPLTQGYLSYAIDEQYTVPKAGVGSYILTLSNGTETISKTLSIREDPLLKER